MLAKGVSAETIHKAAEQTGVRVVSGGMWCSRGRGSAVLVPVNGRPDRWRFVLRTASRVNRKDAIKYGRYGFVRNRTTGNRRRTPGSVCWHGHRDFMRALFAMAPDAVLVTAFATYKGREHFESSHWETGDRNVGSQMDPVTISELCDCEE